MNKKRILKILAVFIIALSIVIWRLHFYKEPVIFNYHQYDPPVYQYMVNGMLEETANDPILYAIRAGVQAENMDQVKERYTEYDYNLIKNEYYKDGISILWDPSIITKEHIEAAKKIVILCRFEYKSLNGKYVAFYIIRGDDLQQLFMKIVVMENGEWKGVFSMRESIWGKDVKGIRKAFHTSKERNSLITEEKLEVLVRGVLEELKKEQVTSSNKGK